MKTKDYLKTENFDRIVQTQDGFIWLRGTQGLIRFDGKNFASGDDIHPNIKLPSDVYGLVTGHNGELWFGSRDSLYCRLANGDFKRFDSKDGVPDGESIAIFVDSEGTLWIWVPQTGLVELKDGRFLTCPGSQEIAAQEIYSMCETPKGFWVATTLGAYRIDKGSGKITTFSERDGLPADQVYAVTTDRRGRVWVATENGLARFDGDGPFQPVATEIGSVEIQSMITDSHGMIWAAGRDLSRIDPETGHVSRRLPEPAGRIPYVGYVYEDREGNIWASTNLGLERLSDVKFTMYTARDGLSNDAINVVTAGASGRIWIGTTDGLACLVDGKIAPISLAPKGETPASTAVYAVYEDPQGVLWFGLGDTTLNRLEHGQQQQVATLNQLPHNGPCWATGMQSDGNGDLWVGTGGAGLLHFRESKLVKAYSSDAVFAIVCLLWRWRLQQILEERTRLSRELHDTVARGSVGVLWQIEEAKNLVKKAGDDGVGFDYQPGGHSIRNGPSSHDSAISSGLGILGIEERCRQLGGKMRVESSHQCGTMIEITVPRRLPIWAWRWRRSDRDSPD